MSIVGRIIYKRVDLQCVLDHLRSCQGRTVQQPNLLQVFSKIMIKSETYFSVDCGRSTKRNSYTIMYSSGDSVQFGQIQYFVLYGSCTSAVVRELKPCAGTIRNCLNVTTDSMSKTLLLPVHSTTMVRVIHVDRILEKCVCSVWRYTVYLSISKPCTCRLIAVEVATTCLQSSTLLSLLTSLFYNFLSHKTWSYAHLTWLNCGSLNHALSRLSSARIAGVLVRVPSRSIIVSCHDFALERWGSWPRRSPRNRERQCVICLKGRQFAGKRASKRYSTIMRNAQSSCANYRG